MSMLKKILINITGNGFSQKLLEKSVFISQFLMGIGSGSGVNSSGEEIVIDVLARKYSPPYCIFDVGSNKGQFANLVLRTIATDNFLIHCFEPSSDAFNILQQNFKKDNRIKLNNIGLGNESGDMTLYYDTPGSGIASLTKRKLDHFGIDFNKSEMVKIDTVDNYCQENSINRIHLLKLDVEGHELDVLAGASGMFERNAIDIVSFEFGGCNIDTRSFFKIFTIFSVMLI